ncbi:molybdenum ABC transporter ATP-binding protein [Pseudotabrizicola algicola]|uniref:Molybdenum ABC transporter ATP-binding protein n=1 Tax=Pseudotabrizicola algicola TaxID=2709381 RepID=A0A6B3RHW6_9RHOB|nr:molybdenum ABC transporter ATP-binding protein [Pseudotabrizicola algicola]NEX45627.1 molybdenum ABC transporter ATP-binding protein [Pseudotabrizicola algicola]
MTLQISLRHRFAGFALDVAFDAPPGVTALFGRSGSGKSTVINAVAGLLRPDAGTITAAGSTLFDSAHGIDLPPHRRRIGYVFQDARLFPHLTVRQNLLYGRWFVPATPDAPDFTRIVDLLGIAPLLERRPATLSGGEKSRVAIGRAILSNPRLLALDEPLAALDEARKAEILPYLERLRDDLHLPILYVSHAMAEVARLANTVVLMDAGRVTASGPTAALLSDPATAPGLGLREAGALLTVRVAAQEDDGLTRLDSASGPLWLPRVAAPTGASLRIRILAQDVMLATSRPVGISALNILPATVRDIRQGDGPGALVRLDAKGEVILARITRRSAQALALTPGLPVYAIIKALSVAQENVGSG